MIKLLKPFTLDISLVIIGIIASIIMYHDGSPVEIVKNIKSIWAECKHDCAEETPEEWRAKLEERRKEKARKKQDEELGKHLNIFLKISCERDGMEDSCKRLQELKNNQPNQ